MKMHNRAIKRISCAALALCALAACLVLAGCGRSAYYDYTGDTDNIASVELINVTKTSGNDESMEYETLRVFDKAEWEEVLSDAAQLRYHGVFGDPPFWREGTALKITFIEPEDGLCYVLLTKCSKVDAVQKDGWIDLNSYSWPCDYDAFDAFVKKYAGE